MPLSHTKPAMTRDVARKSPDSPWIFGRKWLIVAGVGGLIWGVLTDSYVPSMSDRVRALSATSAASELKKPHPSVITTHTPSTPVIISAEIPSESVKARKSGKEAGVFRGDWGETPTYQKNDRVNYQRDAYLSLQHGNHNNPPDTSPDFWRLVKKAAEFHAENCLNPGPGAKLGECDFTKGMSLNGLDLRGADLSKTRLSGDLGTANLSGANLSGAAVWGSLTISPNTRLDHANLSGLQSGGNNPLIAEQAHLTGTNFTQANLYGANLRGATLDMANLSGATLTGANLSETQMHNANLAKADLSFVQLAGGRLEHAHLGGADLTQADLSDARLGEAELRGANLAGSNLAGADFSGADLSGVNFADAQGAETAHVDGNTVFTGAVCPDGVTVEGIQVATCVGHGF